MKIPGYCVLIAMLVVLLAVAAGCTTPQQAPAATQAPVQTATPQATYQAPAATAAQRSGADIDTTITLKSGSFACLNVQEAIGTTYLYDGDELKLETASPGANTINVNVLFLDENDQLGFRQIKPRRDTIKNAWVYDGIVPLVQFNDITTPVEKTFKIKRQSKYYICADDRQEAAVGDNTYRVPVKLTRL
jgi:hypothetical protein